MAALMPVISSGKNQNPQTILIGTPPGPGCGAEVFSDTRKKALSDNPGRTCWHEWSVDELPQEPTWELVEQTNPALDVRLMRSAVDAEMSAMPIEFFARERLGYWSKGRASAVIPRDDWDACATENPPDDGIKCFAAKFSPDGRTVALCVCLKSRDDSFKPHIELVFHRTMDSGVSWLVSFLASRAGDTAEILIDGVGTAENVRERLLRAGAGRNKVRIPRYTEVAAANAALLDAVRSRSITHYRDESLDAAAHGCTRRKIGTNGGWGFASSEDGDAAVIEAAALALLASTNTKRDPKRRARIG